jgi:hypothetical protein
MRHIKLFASINSPDEVKSKAEMLRELIPGLGEIVLLTPEQAANVIGVRSALLKRWRSTHQGPLYFKIGSRVRYYLNSLLEFIDRRRSWLEAIAHNANNLSRSSSSQPNSGSFR